MRNPISTIILYAVLLVSVFSLTTGAAQATVYALIVDQTNQDSLNTIGKVAGKLAVSMGQDDTLVIYNGTKREVVKSLTIPEARHYEAPKFRKSFLRKNFGDVARFIKESKANPPAVADNDLITMFREFSETVRSSYPKDDVHVLLHASSQYEDKRQPGYSMRNAAYPSDGHFKADGFTSPFGVADRGEAYAQTYIHWCIADDEFFSAAHFEAVNRVWALYVNEQSGTLNSFTKDHTQCLSRYLMKSDPARSFAIKANPKKSTMIHMKPIKWTKGGKVDSVPFKGKDIVKKTPPKPTDIKQGAQFLNKNVLTNSTPPISTIDQLKIGISWDCECDLDLHVAYREGKALNYKNKTSAYGKFYKDLTNSTSAKNAFEYAEFTREIEAKDLQIAVNLFKGTPVNGASGFIRIWLPNQSGVWGIPFHIKATKGDAGSGSRESDTWVTVNPADIFRLSGVKG